MEDLLVEIGEMDYQIAYTNNNPSEIYVNGNLYRIELLKKIDERIWTLSVNNRIVRIEFDLDTNGNATIYIDGFSFDVVITTALKKVLKQFIEKASSSTAASIIKIKAPMPGLVVKVIAEEGTQIEKGDGLAIIEAMKMENTIKSPAKGLAKNIKIKTGDTVEKDFLLLELHPIENE